LFGGNPSWVHLATAISLKNDHPHGSIVDKIIIMSFFWIILSPPRSYSTGCDTHWKNEEIEESSDLVDHFLEEELCRECGPIVTQVVQEPPAELLEREMNEDEAEYPLSFRRWSRRQRYYNNTMLLQFL
jgi:hypothetical protein